MTGREIGFTIFAVLGLVCVRLLAPIVFYDPFISFFHQGDYQIQALPEVSYLHYLFSLFTRYLINSILTLVIIKGVFKRGEIIQLTAVLLAIAFIVLTPILFYLIWDGSPSNYQFLFYVRRILIHPVLALVLIPAYLYHQKKSNAKAEVANK